MPGLIDIDERFLDVDFEKEAQKHGFMLGCAPTPFSELLCGDSYEATEELLSDNEIDEAFERQEAQQDGAAWLVKMIFDQGQEGSCVGNAYTQGHMMRQAFQFGIDNVIDLSAMSLYKQIGRSAQSGATISGGREAFTSTGILPLDTPANRQRFGDRVMSPRGFSQGYPAGWKDTAKLFVGLGVKVISSMQGMWDALAKRRPVVVGRRGHSIVYAGGVRRSGKRFAPYPNSWRDTWGQAYALMKGGFGFDSETLIRESASYAVAICSVRSAQPGG